jgi:hydrogenase maturation protein HypF
MRLRREMREQAGITVRVRGLVQGVGFRPLVWRLARELDLAGDVLNDSQGVVIRLWGDGEKREAFLARIRTEAPPLARIDGLELTSLEEPAPGNDFQILPSREGEIRTGVVPDAATCSACRAEVLDPNNRRFRYPFTNCTHCGPRLSILRAIPYDRENTSMHPFAMCDACRGEYEDPVDRRFHAQPNACADCGPRLWLEAIEGEEIHPGGEQDVIQVAAGLIRQGKIVAVKGIGGFHLACDATNEQTVERLRSRKRRFRKPFALMAKDADMVARYCHLSSVENTLLQSPAAPIVLLPSRDENRIAPSVAPGQRTLGCMLPYTPLHTLLMEEMQAPLVFTSGNLSEEPQVIDNQAARSRLATLADYLLLHDREIINRVDDSVMRVMADEPRLVRRARGYAPTLLPLPAGFAQAPPVLALGGELKNSFCLIKEGQAILSQHLGDLEDADTYQAYRATLELYRDLFRHRPESVAMDMHPHYRSCHYGKELAQAQGWRLEQVQHHHAHIASCLAENGWGLDHGPVLGIALDGLGYGPDGTLWGGEFMLADYRGFRRLGHLRTFPMPGGSKAVQEPWRSCYAQLAGCLEWERLRQRSDLELLHYLNGKPLEMLQRMLERGLNSPLTSSVGRLFDGVAAALGICREEVFYEGQAAIELEALIPPGLDGGIYPFHMRSEGGMAVLDPAPMWHALLDDLAAGRSREEMAAAFHQGLAAAVVQMAVRLAAAEGLGTVALSGGVFQNPVLFEQVLNGLQKAGFRTLSQGLVPANDGGLALGQALVAAARIMEREV